MNTATEPILEIIESSDDWKSASDINVNLQVEFDDPPSRSTVYRALSDLTEYEYTGAKEFSHPHLVEEREFQNYGTYYHITDLGKAYLEGEIDGGEFTDEG